jgi:hypothetical protein
MTAADRLADLMTATLTTGAVELARVAPRQVSTSVTPEVVDLAMAVRRQCVELVARTVDCAVFARHLRALTGIVEQGIPPTVVAGEVS